VSEVITFGGNYYIFWIEGRQAGKMKPKEEVDAEIERRIMIERKRVATEKWMEKLRKKATIIRY
jgi:parvulin-like peptidyl-prolyl isomerase